MNEIHMQIMEVLEAYTDGDLMNDQQLMSELIEEDTYNMLAVDFEFTLGICIQEEMPNPEETTLADFMTFIEQFCPE